MKKKNLCLVMSLVLVIGIMFFTAVHNSEAKEKIVLKFVHVWPPGHINYLTAMYFADLVKKESNGSVEIQVYPAEQLVKGKEIPQAISRGVVDMGMVIGAYIAGKMPLIDIEFLPLLYDYSTGLKAHRAGMSEIIGKEYLKAFDMKMLWISPGGSMELYTTSKPVSKLQDFKGMMIRGGGGALTDTVEAFGATSVTMPSPEVYTALQRKTMDGAILGNTTFYAEKMWEVCKFGTKLSQDFGPVFVNVCINMDRWNKLPPEVQKILIDCGVKTEDWGIMMIKKLIKETWEEAEKGGMTIVTLSPEEESRWIKEAEKVWNLYVSRAGDEGRKLLDIAKRFRKVSR